MAHIDDLISQVQDERLRRDMEKALATLKRRQKFGLVYEEHIPEYTALFGLPIQVDDLVHRRDDPKGKKRYVVTAVSGDGESVTVEPESGGDPEEMAGSDLLTLKRFGEPIFPALTPVGDVRRGGDDRPHHAVINAENYHALQVLLYLYEGQVDCIYLDPPYNTGARDWKYNNRYVDGKDSWRHSKWLSMMERRLKLAKRLLKPDGVLVVTIDEHEVHHLGVLLEQLFPGYLRHMVTIVMNPKGTGKLNFSRVDEYAIFCVPDNGSSLIAEVPFAFGMPMKVKKRDHRIKEWKGKDGKVRLYRKLALRRDGAESSNRSDRPRQFYAIYVDKQTLKAVDIGPEMDLDDEMVDDAPEGTVAVYPLGGNDQHRVWRYGRDTMTQRIEDDEVEASYTKSSDKYVLYHWKPVKAENVEVRKPRTVWWHSSHDAGAHGSSLLNNFLGQASAFPFPKSVYAVADTLRTVVANRPDALIVDVFAGSGTTFHATALLNTEDGGRRRSIMVTNNEVSDGDVKALASKGRFKGDPEFESLGIFENVTRPRVEAALTGKRPNGEAVPGTDVNDRPFSEGLPENVAFYRLDYLDPDDVALGLQFDAILPMLWLAAGGVGKPEFGAAGGDFSVPEGSTYAVLFKPSRFRAFQEALEGRPDVTHVWLVTDSQAAFAEMRSALPSRLDVEMLYRDYLRNFRINTR